MKAILLVAAAGLMVSTLAACSGNGDKNLNGADSDSVFVEETEAVMVQEGDSGAAAVGVAGTAGVTPNGDTVVTVVDAVNVQ